VKIWPNIFFFVKSFFGQIFYVRSLTKSPVSANKNSFDQNFYIESFAQNIVIVKSILFGQMCGFFGQIFVVFGQNLRFWPKK